jgi:hypothetical protein
MGKIDPSIERRQILESQIKHKEVSAKYGFLSLCWGSGSNASFNIAGAVVVFLLLTGVVFTFWSNDVERIKTFWQIISPFIGTAFGFLFGQAVKPRSEN